MTRNLSPIMKAVFGDFGLNPFDHFDCFFGKSSDFGDLRPVVRHIVDSYKGVRRGSVRGPQSEPKKPLHKRKNDKCFMQFVTVHVNERTITKIYASNTKDKKIYVYTLKKP